MNMIKILKKSGVNMREIKYRFFHKKENYIAPVSEIYLNIDGKVNYVKSFHLNILGYELFARGENIILMQYTGLKDINGKEIYEGDIIKQINNKYGQENNFIGVVEYNLSGFCLKCVKGANINSYYSFSIYGESENLTKGEIIGNIYENSDLLDSENDLY